MDEQLLSWLPEPSRELVRFACTRMQHSYKPVLMRIFVEALPNLTIPMAEVADKFTAFYLDREARGLPIESRHTPFIVAGRCDPRACRAVAQKIVSAVFELRHGYAYVAGGQVTLLGPDCWLPLAEGPAKQIVFDLLSRALVSYYEKIVLRGEAVYGRKAERDEGTTDPLVFDLPDTDEGDFLLVL